MKRIKLLIMAMAITASYSLTAQVAINQDDSNPDPSAMLDIKSTNKGLLPPRMTEAEIELIVNPANGLMVFNTTNNKIYIFVSTDNEWKELNYSSGTITPYCGNAIIDSRDSKSYSTVQIGTQCWMGENLNVGTRINGGTNQTDNDTIEKYCYNDVVANCNTYGGLYQWDEMMQYTTDTATQGICPGGWHLPTDNEWKIMEMQIGMSLTDANKIGYRGIDEGSKIAGNETLWADGGLDQNVNFGTSGFVGLPGGNLFVNGSFFSLTTGANFWSSSESGSGVWNRHLNYRYPKLYRTSANSKASGYSIRCLKD